MGSQMRNLSRRKQYAIWIKVCEASQTHPARGTRKQLGRCWQPTMKRPQDLLLGGLPLSSFTYQSSPSSLFFMQFPHTRVCPKLKRGFGDGFNRTEQLFLTQNNPICPQGFCSGFSFYSILWAERECNKSTWLEVKIQQKIMKLSLFCDVRFPSPCTFMLPASLKLLPGEKLTISITFIVCLFQR